MFEKTELCELGAAELIFGIS